MACVSWLLVQPSLNGRTRDHFFFLRACVCVESPSIFVDTSIRNTIMLCCPQLAAVRRGVNELHFLRLSLGMPVRIIRWWFGWKVKARKIKYAIACFGNKRCRKWPTFLVAPLVPYLGTRFRFFCDCILPASSGVNSSSEHPPDNFGAGLRGEGGICSVCMLIYKMTLSGKEQESKPQP